MELTQHSVTTERRRQSQTTNTNENPVSLYARLKFNFRRIFATPTWALAFVSFGHFLDESVANGLFGGTLASVEKQFQIRPSESGYIGAMMDIGAALTVIVSAYYGERMSKPRSIGISLLLCGVGCFLYVTPQFALPDAVSRSDEAQLCGNTTVDDCYLSSPLRNFRFLFMVGMLFCGFGIEYPRTIGISYLDENTTQSRSSIFTGVLYGASGLGPLFGYVLGAATLRSSNNSATLSTGDWWIGFLVVGSGLVVSSIPVYVLPKNLGNRDEIKQNREQRVTKKNNVHNKALGARIMSLLKNPVYICISLWTLMYECLIYAVAAYAVKVCVELMGMNESTAGFLLGGMGVGVSVAAYVSGGIIVSKFDLKLRGIVRFVFCCNIASLAFVFVFLLPCSEKEFFGVKSYEHFNVSITHHCNGDCECSKDFYFPVCDNSGVMYYSPCYAGCGNHLNDTVYTGCKCVDGSSNASVSAEYCPDELCGHTYTIFGVMMLSLFLGYVTAVPSIQATIRSVTFQERTMALSVQAVVLIVCGRVLGRIMFAECFDNACMLSSYICGEKGACRLYNKSVLARNITILFSTVKFLGVVFAGFTMFFIAREGKDARKRDSTVATVS